MLNRKWLAVLAVTGWAMAMDVQPAGAQAVDLTKLSLEDLLSIEITSVSRKDQTLSRTAAAVYVITQEDIRRSGSKTIPDVLRMAPGLFVGQIDASSWAISARGFSGLYASKLLVLVDGRSVYTPLFGGVHWDMQNVPLDDIERIEVIRGSGGTLWGANAVNGVINIITKPASETRGGLVTARLGTLDERVGEARYGGALGTKGRYRVHGGYVERGSDIHDGASMAGAVANVTHPDTTRVGLGGMRLDWRDDVDAFSVNGLLQQGKGQHLRTSVILSEPWTTVRNFPVTFTEGNVSMRWTRSHSSRSETGVQTSYQDYTRVEYATPHRLHVGEIEARHQRSVGRRQEFVAGIGYRLVSSFVRPTSNESAPVLPEETTGVLSGFFNDEIDLTGDVRLTLGTKIERNPYSGVEVQPAARVNWTPSSGQALWMALSRAVRTPTQLDRSLQFVSPIGVSPNGLPMLMRLEGSPDYESEVVKALEAGYRWDRGTVSVDVTGFWNAYDKLRGVEVAAPAPYVYLGSPALVVAQRFVNALDATAHGAELSATWLPVHWWKVSGSYTHLRLTAGNPRDATTSVAPYLEGQVPARQVHARTYIDLPGNIEAGALFYGTSANDPVALDWSRKLDLSLRWRTTRSIELSATMRNLLHDDTREYTDIAAPVSIPVQTSLFAEVGWRF